MKNRKKLLIGTGIVLAAALIVVMIALPVAKRDKEAIPPHDPYIGRVLPEPANATPGGAVTGMLGALRDWDMGLAAQWMSEIPDGIFSEAYHEVLAPSLSRLEFECGAEKIEGSTAMVDVAVTSVDLGAALGDLTADAAGYLLGCALTKDDPDWAGFLTEYAGTLDASNLLRVKRNATAHLTLDSGGKWRLDAQNPENREFYNAVTGGMLDVLDYLSEVASVL